MKELEVLAKYSWVSLGAQDGRRLIAESFYPTSKDKQAKARIVLREFTDANLESVSARQTIVKAVRKAVV
jgi:hypothetical protein